MLRRIHHQQGRVLPLRKHAVTSVHSAFLGYCCLKSTRRPCRCFHASFFLPIFRMIEDPDPLGFMCNLQTWTTSLCWWIYLQSTVLTLCIWKNMFLFLACFLVHSRDSKIVTSSHLEFYLAIVWSWKYHISSSFMYVSPQYPKWSLKFIEPPGSEMWARLFVGLDLLTQESSWCGSYSCPGLAEPFTARGPLMELSGRRLFLNEFLSEGSTRPDRENSDKERTNRELKDDLRRTTQQWGKPLWSEVTPCTLLVIPP